MNQLNNRLFVLADIHGEIEHLNTVLALIAAEANFDLDTGDWLVNLGDKADRGRHSYEVIETFYALHEKYPEQVHCLLGNHSAMLLDAASMHPTKTECFYWNGGQATLESYSRKTGFYGKRSLGNSLAMTGHGEFIKSHPTFLETPDYFFSHAPIPKVGFAGRRADRDFRTDSHLLTWAYSDAPENLWVDPDPCNGRLAVFGHVHGLKEKIVRLPNGDIDEVVIVPGVRRYGNAVLLDTGCGCAREGYLSCLELPARKIYTSRGEVYDLPNG